MSIPPTAPVPNVLLPLAPTPCANIKGNKPITIAKELGLRGRTNTVLQSAFFNLTGIIPSDKAIELMKDAATRSFSKKGEEVVKMNHSAIERGANGAVKVDVPAAWADADDTVVEKTIVSDRPEMVDFVKNILDPINEQKGDALPVSAFVKAADGTFPQGSAAFEKRGVAVFPGLSLHFTVAAGLCQ